MPVGGFAGPRKIMKHLSPEGGVYQAGTLSGNPVAMTAGLTTLRVLQKEDGWKRLEALGAYLEQTLTAVLAEAPVPAKLVRLGSLFWIAWLRHRSAALGRGARRERRERLRARLPLVARPGHRARAVGVRDRVPVARAYAPRHRPPRRRLARGARHGGGRVRLKRKAEHER